MTQISTGEISGQLRGAATLLDQEIARYTHRLSVLKEEINSLNHEARKVEREMERVKAARRHLEFVEWTDAPQVAAHPKKRRGRQDGQAQTIRNHAYRILKNTGHPLSRAEILHRLSDEGVQVASKNPAQRIQRILWEASDTFEYREFGYWIVGEPITAFVEREKRYRTRKTIKE